MTRKTIASIVLILFLLTIIQACGNNPLLSTNNPASTPAGEFIQMPPPAPILTAIAAKDIPQNKTNMPTATQTVVLQPTYTGLNQGQIIYAEDGNIWQYIVGSGEKNQITNDGNPDDQSTIYSNLELSADGRYIYYIQNSISYIQNLTDNAIITLEPDEFFIQWSQIIGDEFYIAQGDSICSSTYGPDGYEDIHFKIFRYRMNDLEHPNLIGSITGELDLNYTKKISNDEQYLSLMMGACHEQMVSITVYHLPSGTAYLPDPWKWVGSVDFSPSSSQIAIQLANELSETTLPLFISNPDFSNMSKKFTILYGQASNPRWSPTGEWITFAAHSRWDGKKNTQINLINPQATELIKVLEISEGSIFIVDWSPDGTQLLIGQGERNAYQTYLYDLSTSSMTLLPIPASHDMDWGNLP